jgi:hypothetical protein
MPVNVRLEEEKKNLEEEKISAENRARENELRAN